jgi:hypothetical protein
MIRKKAVLFIFILILSIFSTIVIAEKKLIDSKKYDQGNKINLNNTEYEILIDRSRGKSIVLTKGDNISIISHTGECIVFGEDEFCFIYESNMSVIVEHYNISPNIELRIINKSRLMTGHEKIIRIEINNTGGMDIESLELIQTFPDDLIIVSTSGCNKKKYGIQWKGKIKADESKICTVNIKGNKENVITTNTTITYDVLKRLHTITDTDYSFEIYSPFNYSFIVPENITIGEEFLLSMNFLNLEESNNITLSEVRVLNMKGLERIEDKKEHELINNKKIIFNKSINETAYFRITEAISEIPIKILYKIDSYADFIYSLPIKVIDSRLLFTINTKDSYISGKEQYIEIYSKKPNPKMNYTSALIKTISEDIEFLNDSLRIKENTALLIPFVSFKENKHTIIFNITYYDSFKNKYSEILTKNIIVKPPGSLDLSQHIDYDNSKNMSILHISLENKVGEDIYNISLHSIIGTKNISIIANISNNEKKEILNLEISDEELLSLKRIETKFLYPFGMTYINGSRAIEIEPSKILPKLPEKLSIIDNQSNVTEENKEEQQKMSPMLTYIIIGGIIFLIAGIIIYFFGLKDFLRKRQDKRKSNDSTEKNISDDTINAKLKAKEPDKDSKKQDSAKSSNNKSVLTDYEITKRLNAIGDNSQTSNNSSQKTNVTQVSHKPKKIIVGTETIHQKMDELEKEINILIDKSDDNPNYLKIAEQKGRQYKILKRKLDSLEL